MSLIAISYLLDFFCRSTSPVIFACCWDTHLFAVSSADSFCRFLYSSGSPSLSRVSASFFICPDSSVRLFEGISGRSLTDSHLSSLQALRAASSRPFARMKKVCISALRSLLSLSSSANRLVSVSFVISCCDSYSFSALKAFSASSFLLAASSCMNFLKSLNRWGVSPFSS